MSDQLPTFPHELRIVVSINEDGSLGTVEVRRDLSPLSTSPLIELEEGTPREFRFSGFEAAGTDQIGIRVSATRGLLLSPRCRMALVEESTPLAAGAGEILIGGITLNELRTLELHVAPLDETHIFEFGVGAGNAADEETISLDDIKTTTVSPPPHGSGGITDAPVNEAHDNAGFSMLRSGAGPNGGSLPRSPAGDVIQRRKAERSGPHSVAQHRITGNHEVKR